MSGRRAEGEPVLCPTCGRLLFYHKGGSAVVEIVCRSTRCKGQKYHLSIGGRCGKNEGGKGQEAPQAQGG